MLTQVHREKWPLKRRVCVCVCVLTDYLCVFVCGVHAASAAL